MPIAGVKPQAIREAERRPAPPARQFGAPVGRPQVPNYVETHAPRPTYTPQPQARPQSRPQPQQRPSWGSFPAAHPFAQAQHQAAQRVQKASQALPQERLYAPQLPIVPNPTMAQQYTAYRAAQQFQQAHLGANPSRQRELQFHHEVAADPRNASFVQALSHYLHAGSQEAAQAGLGSTGQPFMRGQIGGAQNPIDAAVSAWKGIDPKDRLRLEGEQRKWLREGQQQLERQNRERQQHAGDVKLPLVGATINPEKLVGALATLKIPGIDALGAVGRGVNEVFDLPGQALLAGSIAGGAVRKKVEGGDILGAGTVVPKMFGEGVTEAAKHPLAHPVSNALMLAAAGNIAGGVVGTAGRGLARAGLAPARTFSRAAPDIALYGEGQLVPHGQGEGFVHGQVAPREGLRVAGRTRSRDPLRAGIQALLEKRAYQPSELSAQPGSRAAALPAGKQVLQASGRRLQRHVSGGTFKVGTVDIAKGAEQRTRVGMVRGTVNRVMERQKEKAGELMGVRPKQGAEAVSMIAERAIRGPQHFKEDLAAEAGKLREAAKATDAQGNPKLVGPDRAANKANLELVEGLLNDEKLQAHVAEKGLESEPYRAAARVEQIQKPIENMLVRGGKLLPPQLRAALTTYAINHMEGRHVTADEHATLEADALSSGLSRERALQLGGVHVPAAQEHFAAGERLSMAAEKVAQADKEVARASRRRSEIVGRQRSARHSQQSVDKGLNELGLPARQRIGRGPRRATSKEQDQLSSATEAVGQARERLKAAERAHRDARDEAKASPFPERSSGLRGPHGEQLPDEVILNQMRHEGLTPPVYVSHVRGVAGKGSFYRAVSRQPSLEHYTRTGAAHAQGLNDKSWPALVGSMAKQASEAAQLELRRRFLNRFVIDRFRQAKQAHAAIENFRADPAGQRIRDAESLGGLRVIHYGSGQIVGSKGFQEAVDPAEIRDVLRQFGHEEHTPIHTDELGHFGVIPGHVWDRYLAHDDAMHAKGDEARALQAYASAWRRAKLNTSMPHIFGVMQEQAIRVLAEQVGPMAWATGRKYDHRLKRIAEVDDKGFMAETAGPLGERFRALEATMGGRGAIASSGRWNDVVRKGEQMQETGSIGQVMRAGERGLDTKGGRAVRAVWHGWSSLIEGGLLRTVEEASHHAHMGKALRESGLIDSYRQVLKAQGDTLDALIQDRLTPNMADAMARRINDMYGNWTQQTPRVRAFVSKWAPFGLWYLNSLRWLYRLPLTHPVKTGVLASMYRATAKQRNAEGQGLDAPQPVPEFLQGSIPVTLPLVGRVKAVPSYYTPMGALGAGYGQTAVEQLLPYATSALGALEGTNVLTHEKLRGPHGEELGPAQAGLNTIAELFAGPTPLATQAQTLLEGGGKRYGTANWITDLAHALGAGPATVKPGTRHTYSEVLGKMFTPTRIIRPPATGAPVSRSQARSEMQQARAAARQERASGGDRAGARRELEEARQAARRERAGR